jgi:hypothetical protein
MNENISFGEIPRLPLRLHFRQPVVSGLAVVVVVFSKGGIGCGSKKKPPPRFELGQ